MFDGLKQKGELYSGRQACRKVLFGVKGPLEGKLLTNVTLADGFWSTVVTSGGRLWQFPS